MPAKYRTLLIVLLVCAGVYAVAAYLLPKRVPQLAETPSPAPSATAAPAPMASPLRQRRPLPASG